MLRTQYVYRCGLSLIPPFSFCLQRANREPRTANREPRLLLLQGVIFIKSEACYDPLFLQILLVFINFLSNTNDTNQQTNNQQNQQNQQNQPTNQPTNQQPTTNNQQPPWVVSFWKKKKNYIYIYFSLPSGRKLQEATLLLFTVFSIFLGGSHRLLWMESLR